jgi:hypothetical protein
MRLLPWAALRSDSEQYTHANIFKGTVMQKIKSNCQEKNLPTI